MIKTFIFISLSFFTLYAKDTIIACNYTVLQQNTKTSTGIDVGLGKELINLFTENIPMQVTMRYFTDLEELHKSAKNGECDMIPIMESTLERKQYLKFTKPYFHIPIVMATKQGLPFINNMIILEGKKIAGMKEHSYMKSFMQEYPNIDFIEVSSREEGLNLLRRDEVFGFLDFAQILNFIILEKNMKDIAITAQFNKHIPISIAVKHDEEELFEMIKNSLENIEQERLNRLMVDWFNIGYKIDIDYKLITQIGFLVFGIMGIFFYWNIHLKDLQAKKIQKQAFLLRQNKMAQMGEMIENIAHQWRQPLAQINSAVLLISAFLDKENIKHNGIDKKLDEIELVTQYMSRTIDNFKNYLHPNKQKEIFFLHSFLQEILNIIKGSLESCNVDIEFEIDPNLQISQYKGELKQVVMFIVNNSIEAFGVNEIKNPKIIMNAEIENNILILKIKDNAGGIVQSIIEKIFNPYFTTKHQSKGTGLGLYMTKRIIEDGLMGSIDVYSQAKESVFTIKIPQNIDINNSFS